MLTSLRPTTQSTDPAFRLSDLDIRYPRAEGGGEVVVVDRLSLEIGRGEAVGILGESGSGKTSLALGAMGLLSAAARQTGIVELGGRRIPKDAGERFWRQIRGDTVGIVFQQPSLALHPLRRAGSQIEDVMRAHRPWGARECRERVHRLLGELDLRSDVFDAFPHQLSGGQRQRVVLAQALACGPELLVADEPTTALDRDTEMRVLDLVDRMRRRTSMSMLWISHDPEVLAEVTDRLYVMYGGRWVEEGPTSAVLSDPSHPYTKALLACRPTGRASESTLRSQRRLPVIPGPVSKPGQSQVGCNFAERCHLATDACSQRPSAVSTSERETSRRQVWCVRIEPSHALRAAR